MEVNSHGEGLHKVWQTPELCFALQLRLHKSDLHGRVVRGESALHSHHTIQHQKFAKEHPHQPDGFWKRVKTELWLQRAKGTFGEQRKQCFIQRMSV